MTENQRRAQDQLTARDLIIRAITTLGLIGAVLALLIAVNPT
ncbi:MAG: hypothetical protein ACRDJH_25100 [Thermomicrobiales bacterium]